jgi:hypothetical protein
MAVQLTTFKDPQALTLAIGAVNKSSHVGKFTLSFPDGTVVSCQQDGSIQDRPSGADAAFEQCDIDGQVATYWYIWNGVTSGPFSFAFFKVTGKS